MFLFMNYGLEIGNRATYHGCAVFATPLAALLNGVAILEVVPAALSSNDVARLDVRVHAD
jgi:hypothetical protein